ncbi:MAG: hypothetical protein EOO10_02680 [Chitinophagaceae bacterium]|nr:MAG: hypothetical protein EOO10_02680 [Chitinophagaceae bacterium]
MSSVVSANGTERARIFETVLSSPGMSETCKIVLNPSRQTILLLSRMIEQGMEARENGAGDELLSHLPAESVNEVKSVLDEMLKKSGLVDFYGRLKTL